MVSFLLIDGCYKGSCLIDLGGFRQGLGRDYLP